MESEINKEEKADTQESSENDKKEESKKNGEVKDVISTENNIKDTPVDDNKDKKDENKINEIPPSSSENKKEIKKHELTEEKIKLFDKIKEYFSGPNKDEKNEVQDLSYSTWVEKNQNIKKLCEPYEVDYLNDKNSSESSQGNNNVFPTKKVSKNLYGVFENHDFSCELKLLKWITEDENHKNKFIKIDTKQKNLNKHNDILPYEYNIVPMDKNNSEKSSISNYINASCIAGPFDNQSKLFIATQTPSVDTIASFWNMVYTHKVKLIIMLSDTLEEKEEKYKIYWPNSKEEALKINQENINLDIELIHKEEVAPQIALLRKFKINNDLEVKQIL